MNKRLSNESKGTSDAKQNPTHDCEAEVRSSAFNLSGGGLLISRDLFVIMFLLLAVAAPPFYAQTATTTSPGVATKTPQVTVVDIMPESLSGETDNDSEPNIAVNPAHPLQIAASAFTREPMRRPDRAPIFVSTDAGNSFSLRSILRSPQITCDCTLRFGSSSDVLYVSALRNEKDGYTKQELMICQTREYSTTRLMEEVLKNRNHIDQPYIAAMTVKSKDHVFVGNSDMNYPIGQDYPTGQAVIERSLGAVRTSFSPVPIEYQPTTIDWSEVRPAITANGNVVYAAFNRITSLSDDGTPVMSEVVVVRDDQGGASKTPFSSLDDPQGGHGLRVVKQRVFAWDKCLGGDRLGDDLAIAVHPTNPNKVYLVWGDWGNGHANLHLKYSTDRGKTWADRKWDISDAKNPGLAVNAKGTVGFLYQQVVNLPDGKTWRTQFEQTTDDFQTQPQPQPLILAQFPVPPVDSDCGGGNILLGDYLHLMSVGNDFYGIFSSDNNPDRSHFPSGVKFQRREDRDQKKLLDLRGKEVDPSIDPFFFKVTEQ